MHKNSYTIDKKLKIINLALDYGVSLISKKTRIHQSIIYRWISDKIKLEQTNLKSNVRKIGAGRKVVLTMEIESDIASWITNRNQQDLLVNFKLV
jgi:transposase-like protein